MDFVPHLASDSGRLARVVRRLEREDALSLSLLDPEGCAIALAGVEALSLRTARPVVGAGERIVRQDFEDCTEIPETSPLRSLAESLERLMVDSLDRLASSPLALRLRFNDLIVQRYRAGSSGISPHRDHVRYVGLVLVVVLAGDGRFCVCEDRSGTGARAVAAGPGDGILMRAPGFAENRDRPFHFLADVTEPRYSFGLRHDSRARQSLYQNA